MNVKGQVLELRDRVDALALGVAHERPDDKPPARFLGYQSQPVPLQASTLMLSVPGIGELLRDKFVEVPAERVENAGDRNVAVRCPCGRELTLAYGGLTRCSCWRFYFNLKTLRVTEPPAPDELVMCDDCDADLAHKDGAWIRVAGDDRFVCPGCHERAVAGGDVDLFGDAA